MQLATWTQEPPPAVWGGGVTMSSLLSMNDDKIGSLWLLVGRGEDRSV
jgi:hypothetical protein